jgi:hypothetical protein
MFSRLREAEEDIEELKVICMDLLRMVETLAKDKGLRLHRVDPDDLPEYHVWGLIKEKGETHADHEK